MDYENLWICKVHPDWKGFKVGKVYRARYHRAGDMYIFEHTKWAMDARYFKIHFRRPEFIDIWGMKRNNVSG